MKSRAMVAVAPNQLELQEFDVVPPEDEQILIKTKATSICSTDLKILHGKTPIGLFPVIMGHEFVGEIVQIGARASTVYNLEIGDRVTPEPYIPCGHCRWCRTDHHYHNCTNVKTYGGSLSCSEPPHLFGGYADYVYLCPGSILHKVAPGVSDLSACLSSVVGNGVRWVNTLGQMSFGQSLVISGVGSQGLCALAAAKEAGVASAVMLGLRKDHARFELAREFGADFMIRVDQDDPLEKVPELIGGQPDVVIETSGVSHAIKTGFKLVRTSGRVVVIGLSGGVETTLPFDDLVWRDITVVCGKGQAGNVGDAMRLINSKKYPFEKINNFHYPLADLPKALEDTANPPEGFIKGAIVF